MGKALGGINQASRSDAVTAVMVGLGATLGAMAINVLTPIAAEAQTPPTVTPIKHLIVVIGENRSFDNVFGTYVPPPGQSVWNLLSQGIVNQTGAPGLSAAKALQRQADATGKSTYQPAPPTTVAFPTLPQPSTTLSALPVSPCSLSTILAAFGKNPANYSFCNDDGLSPR
jgi:phospholipase C